MDFLINWVIQVWPRVNGSLKFTTLFRRIRYLTTKFHISLPYFKACFNIDRTPSLARYPNQYRLLDIKFEKICFTCLAIKLKNTTLLKSFMLRDFKLEWSGGGVNDIYSLHQLKPQIIV